MSSTVPSKRLSACSRMSALAISRWFVGSSRHRSGAGATSIFASANDTFATGKHAHALVDGVIGKQERTEKAPNLAHSPTRSSTIKFLEHGVAG